MRGLSTEGQTIIPLDREQLGENCSFQVMPI